MRAIGLTEFGGPEVLHEVDLPAEPLGQGQVRLRVRAAAAGDGRRANDASGNRGVQRLPSIGSELGEVEAGRALTATGGGTGVGGAMEAAVGCAP